MKHVISLVSLSLLLSFSMPLCAQGTGGIVGTPINASDMLGGVQAELFGSKEKRRLRDNIARLEEHNLRLDRQIRDLERRLDACERGRSNRYTKKRRRRAYDYSLTNDLLGQRRRLEREYEQLKDENEFLRDHRDWLRTELDDCQYRKRRRDDYRNPRDRDRGRRNDDCNCQCPPRRSKGSKGKKYRDWDDD
ncbi:MAG: hypothetical protein AAFY71_13145 [Bacteroidota bacterium]